MLKRICLLLFFVLLSLLGSATASASHLRGTSVSWQPTTTAGTVQFTIQYSQRTSAGGCTGACIVGGTISVPFNYGDGSTGTFVATITSVDSTDDYLSAVGTLNHTYTGVGPYTASYYVSARVSSIKSGASQYLRMETLVTPYASPINHPPVSAMPAIVTVPLQATVNFNLVATDQDNDTLNYRLSTSAEQYGLSTATCAARQPPGLTINNAGQVTWDTTQITQAGCSFTAPIAGDLWTVQFMVQDVDGSGNVKSKTPVDIILEFIDSTEAPPTLTFSNAGPFTVAPGTNLTFTATGDDAAANSRVTMNATGLPLGATVTNTNQSLIPPVATVFSWTPGISQTGSYIVTFTATNDTFEQVLGSVTINVPAVLPPVTSCSATLNAQYNVPLSIPLTVSDPQGDAISVVWVVDGTAVRTDAVPAAATSTSLSLSQTFATPGTHSVVMTATNSQSGSSSCTSTVTVAKADQTISFGSLPNVTYGSPDTAFTATATSGDPVSYTVSGSCSLVGGAVHTTGAGSCSVTANQAGDVHYNAAPPITQQFTIAPAALSVAAQNATRVYGTANPTFTGTIAGIVNGDAITANYASSALPTSLVGTYPIVPTLSGSALPNYTQMVTNGTLTITPGAAAKLVASTPPATLVSGGNVGSLSVTVQDAGGNTVTTSSAPITATITGPNGYAHSVTVAAVNGAASLNLGSFALNTAGTYVVTTTSTGLVGTTAPVIVTAGAATQIATGTVPATVVSGGNLGTLAATIQDANGNTVLTSSAPVTTTITGPNGYSHSVTVAAVNGVASLNLGSFALNAAGTYIVTTSSAGLAGTTSAVTATAGVATQIATGTVPATVVSGGNLGTLAATIQDANGNTVLTSSAPVTTTITGPNGYSHSVTVTAVNGVVSLNLGSFALNTAGTYVVTTSSTGLTGTTSPVTVTAGAATQIATSTVPTTVVSGGNLGTLAATVQDANGNTVLTSSAAITTTITGPNGYSHSVTVTAVNGVASLNLGSLALNTAGSYTVATSSIGLIGSSALVTVTPGTATRIVLGTVPASITSGQNLGMISASLQDANGNVATSFNGTVTLTITGPNGYSQTVTGTAVNGVVSFNLGALGLNAAGIYTITATAPGLTAANSTVTVTAGTPIKLVTGSLPATLVSGGNLGTLVATVEDVNSNTVTTSAAVVTATITGPNGYSQTISTTATGGVANLNLASLALNVAGSYTVTTSSPGLPVVTAVVAVTPGAGTQVVLGTVPSSIISGQSLGMVTATIKDVNGNVATGYTGPITATLIGPNGFSQAVTGNAVNGVVTLDLSSLSPIAAGTYTLSVGAPGLTAATATITVGLAAQSITLPNLPNVTFGVSATTLPATTSAGLPIGYIVTGPAVLNGLSLTVTGAGAVTVAATQPGDAAHSSISANASFTVAPAPSTTVLSSSSGVALTGTPVTLTAQVASTAGMPNGTVTFQNGSTVLGTVTLSANGTATLTVSTLPTGALSLSATYSGATNYAGSQSAAVPTAVQDFGISVTNGSPSVAVVPGMAASFSLALTPGSSGFSSAITFTATGLPAGATFSFSPATVTPGTSTASTVLTVQTAKPTTLARTVSGTAGLTLALLFLPFGVSRKNREALKRSSVLRAFAFLALLGGMAGLTGCGTNDGLFGQPASTTTITVTATSGNISHSTTVVLNVQ